MPISLVYVLKEDIFRICWLLFLLVFSMIIISKCCKIFSDLLKKAMFLSGSGYKSIIQRKYQGPKKD